MKHDAPAGNSKNLSYMCRNIMLFRSHSVDLYTPFNNVSLKVINGILKLVITEKAREEAGGTCGVSVSLTSQKYPWQNVSGLIVFGCDPEKAEALRNVVCDEIGRMEKSGPSKENLQKALKTCSKRGKN